MAETHIQMGFAPINGAQLYYEVAGEGQPLVMIHAGVADRRQWDNEFAHFAQQYRVLRYDQRGYGKSEPVQGEFSYLSDLAALLDYVGMQQPTIVMGCSMGGGTAMDFVLANPERAKALIMVGSAPGGLELDAPKPAILAEIIQADQDQNWALLAELEVRMWFDGMGRTPEQVNPIMRQLAYDMNKIALANEQKGLGKRIDNLPIPAAKRLNELRLPVLVVVGRHDVPYIVMAADVMVEEIAGAQKVIMEDAAHLLNMDHPDEFQRIVSFFLNELV